MAQFRTQADPPQCESHAQVGSHHEATTLGGRRATTTTEEAARVQFQGQGGEGATAQATLQSEGEEASPFAPGRTIEAGSQVEGTKVRGTGKTQETEGFVLGQAQGFGAEGGAESDDLGWAPCQNQRGGRGEEGESQANEAPLR